MVAVKESAIEYGFRHLDTISQLHHSKSPDEQLEAVSIVLESFGLDDESKSHLIQSVNDFVPEGRKTATGWVLMGFIAGLSCAQNATESD
jgi:hypothetical protein